MRNDRPRAICLAASDLEEPASLPPGPSAEPPPTSIVIDAQLGELAVFASGRSPPVWWPPEEVCHEARHALWALGLAKSH
jgi:hypothetical protein